MAIVEITSLDFPGVEVFASLTENELRGKDSGGLFIAESPKVIHTALMSGYQPVSLLCERKHIEGDAAGIIASHPDLPVFTGSRDLLRRLTGYKLTRGVLCAMKRKPLPDASNFCVGARRVAVIESVCDTTNIGSIFRSAAALGIDGIMLTPDSCDPLNRRSIRVSMGSVFRIPWAFHENPVDLLKKYGFITLAMALDKDSIPIYSHQLWNKEKLAIVLGTEGDGLSEEIKSKCDLKVIIPMHHAVDSLNVGAAAALTFWELRVRKNDNES